ncbi:MAG: hypothetical protein AABY18_09175 [Candidatus Thermoplasmatota archaeon]
MRVELVVMRLFDVGAEVDLRAVRTLAGLAPNPAPLEAKSALPRSTAFPRPLEAVLAVPQASLVGTKVEVRLHALGVLALRYRAIVEAPAIAGLDAILHGLLIGGDSVDAAAERMAKQVRLEISAALRDPYEPRIGFEAYNVYCAHLGPGDVPRVLAGDADAIAQLISDSAGQPLVPARRAAAAKHTMQYTPGDAVVVGWDHAVILDEPGEYEDVLDVMELANVELLEFRTYDDYLDRRLESSFDALDRLWRPGGLFRSARAALQDISRLRVEVARLTDNLHDTGKVFGDWYTAQLHRRLHERFHLASWERAVAAKMDTLEDMFHLAQEEANHRRSLALEIAIILLFVLDLAILLRVGG